MTVAQDRGRIAIRIRRTCGPDRPLLRPGPGWTQGALCRNSYDGVLYGTFSYFVG